MAGIDRNFPARVNPLPPPPEIYLPDGSVNLFNSGKYYEKFDLKYYVTKVESFDVCKICLNRCGYVNVDFKFDCKTKRPVTFKYRNLCFFKGTLVTICTNEDMKSPTLLYFGFKKPSESILRLTFKRQKRYIIGIYSNLRCRTDIDMQVVKRRINFANTSER